MKKDTRIEIVDALFVRNYNKCDSFIRSFVHSFIHLFIHSFSEVKYVGKLFEDSAWQVYGAYYLYVPWHNPAVSYYFISR